MNRFVFRPTRLSGLTVVDRKPIEDNRGFLARFFCAEELREAGFGKPVAQINHTLTRQRATVRGLHFQRPPHAEIKLVTCLKGLIFDVAVDLRRDSPTFLQWHAEELSDESPRSLLIPEGFAHGFQTLTEDCEVLYLVSAPYCASEERAINARDPRLAIHWPIPIGLMSDRDKSLPMLDAGFEGLSLA